MSGLRNDGEWGLRTRRPNCDRPAPSDAAPHLPFVAAHRVTIAPAVEKAGALRRTASGPTKEARDEKPTVAAPGVEARVQRKAGAGNVPTRPAGVHDRWRGLENAPVIAHHHRADCTSTSESLPADRMTPTVRMHASSRVFAAFPCSDRGSVSGARPPDGHNNEPALRAAP
jgi:hypothetical protein